MTGFTTKAPYQMYLDGTWMDADSNKTFEVVNPANLELIGTVPLASNVETTRALSAAKKAFTDWSRRPASQRAKYLERIQALILENLEELALFVTLESGKPLKEATGEVLSTADNFGWYAAEARRVNGEVIPADDRRKRILVIRQPIGVAALITPWNFPLNILGRKVATALAAGCTVVAKPAEQTPISAVLLWRILEQAELPAGVANLVTGDPVVIGRELMVNPIAKVIGFTGSTSVGKLLMEGASKHVKKLALELGGHAPFIVFADADIDLAVQSLIANKYRNAGQTCSCTNRVLVQKEIYSTFVAKLSAAVSSLQVGNGLDEQTNVGPLINEEGFAKVKRQMEDALQKGAKAVVGGHEVNSLPGHFYEPTVLVDVTEEMDIMKEETFGPILPIISFDQDTEAIDIANDSPYGLYAFLFTKDMDRCVRMAEALDYGMVGVNEGLITVTQAPAGGFKESGLGREGGHWGIDEYLEIKYIALTLGG